MIGVAQTSSLIPAKAGEAAIMVIVPLIPMPRFIKGR